VEIAGASVRNGGDQYRAAGRSWRQRDVATPTRDRFCALRRQQVVEAVRMFSLVDHYRRLANEAGERAQQATDPSLKSTFAELAKGYVRLELAEQKQT
jgi:hypothetical protein